MTIRPCRDPDLQEREPGEQGKCNTVVLCADGLLALTPHRIFS